MAVRLKTRNRMEIKIDNEALRARYSPEGSKLRENQRALLDILLELADICEKNNIRWWLSSGTLLGAARHGGFIPWDDDVDIAMPRKDFKRLERILHAMDSPKYVYQSMRSDVEYTSVFGKFRKRNDVIHTTGKRHQYLQYKGHFVDIFPVEKTSYFASRAAKVIYDLLQHPTVYIKNKWLRRFMVRSVEVLCLGVIFPLLRIIGLINPRGEYHYALGMAWPKSVFFAEEIFPTTKAEFEGHLFPVPNDMDAFLGRIYGDWRKLPSDEVILRSIHSAEYRSEILERMQ